jgi:hypothetical protein
MTAKCRKNISNGSKILLITEYITTLSMPRSNKIFPNWYFWSEKKPSGNSGLGQSFGRIFSQTHPVTLLGMHLKKECINFF